MKKKKNEFEKRIEANFVCPECSGKLFKISKGYYSKNPILICNKCKLILTLKELKKKQLLGEK